MSFNVNHTLASLAFHGLIRRSVPTQILERFAGRGRRAAATRGGTDTSVESADDFGNIVIVERETRDLLAAENLIRIGAQDFGLNKTTVAAKAANLGGIKHGKEYL